MMKKIRKICLLLAALIVLLQIFQTSAQAAATEVTMAANKSKNVKTLTKTGTYVLTNRSKKAVGYVKFKAPKTGTYVITVDNVTYANESKDQKKNAYYAKKSTKYNREIAFGMQNGSDKNGWTNMTMTDLNTDETNLINHHSLLYYIYMNTTYSGLSEAEDAFVVGKFSDSKLQSFYPENTYSSVTLRVKLKKGAVIRLYTKGDTSKSTCDLTIKKK